ncbi:MAG: SpoIIE family protein phosphatase [Cyclobacteriaceae bacterium]
MEQQQYDTMPERGKALSAHRWGKQWTMFLHRFGVLAVLFFLINCQISIAQSIATPAYALPQKELEHELEVANQKLAEARLHKLPVEEGQLLHRIGIIYQKLGESEASLKHLLWAILALERGQATGKIIAVKRDLGDHHYQNLAYQKSIQYYQAYLKGKERLGEKIPDEPVILQKMARSYFLLGEFEQSQTSYLQLVSMYEKQGERASALAAHKALVDIYKRLDNIPTALQHLEQVEQQYRQQKDTLNLLPTLNDMGFLHKRNQNLRLAMDYFQRALNLPEKYWADKGLRVSILTNLGVTYTNLGFFARAKEAYQEALQLKEASSNIVKQAGIFNYLASNAYVSRNNAQALEYANQAVELAIGKNAYEELATSYKLIALIYEEEKNKERALIYQQSYLEIQRRLNVIQQQKQQDLISIQERAEAQEEYLKASIIEQEQEALDRERQETALKLKENELNLLRKNQALQQAELLNQQLEKDRTVQQLAIAQQALMSEKQNRELSELERLKELQDLELEQQSLEQEQQKKAIALLEAEKKLQQQKLQQEMALRKYGYGIFALCIVVIGVVSYSFLQKRKDNKTLQEQQRKIQEQNEHLKASEQMLISSVKELEATQEALQKQKRQLEIEHHKTQESLQYAKRIQFSILPSEKESQVIFPNNFVIFRPKDVVSGDFYWMSDHGNRKIISVVDCTGHGVPGALVSLIAYNMLDEAINEKNLLDPHAILGYLNRQVRRRLREGDHSIQDGMDIGICMLETKPDRTVHLHYAGAKHTLYAVCDGTLLTLKGARKTVGSIQQEASIEELHLELKLDDAIYLTTDGFIDQSNPERKRFGSRQLKTLIQDLHTLPIAEQEEKFTEALEAHQQSSEQRDDINLIGIRI